MALQDLLNADLDVEVTRRIERAERALAALKQALGELLEGASLPSADPGQRSTLFREMTDAERDLEAAWDEYERRRKARR